MKQHILHIHIHLQQQFNANSAEDIQDGNRRLFIYPWFLPCKTHSFCLTFMIGYSGGKSPELGHICLPLSANSADRDTEDDNEEIDMDFFGDAGSAAAINGGGAC
ncbi:MAG: hypothetical protein ACOZB3_10635 [Calditrichota bacterium]